MLTIVLNHLTFIYNDMTNRLGDDRVAWYQSDSRVPSSNAAQTGSLWPLPNVSYVLII